MDAMIAEDGEEGVLARVMTRIAIGDDPRDIALGMGMPWYVLRKWLEDKAERMQAWELAKRCFADGLVYESLKEVRDCGLEEVPLARLRSETYQKTAGKVSKVEWGAESAVAAGGGGNITIVIGRVESPYRQVADVVGEQIAEVVPQPIPEPMQVSTVEEV
jgi:hypothetical protein